MSADWKRRYLELLRETEGRIRTLEQAQALLRRAVARLALLAEGVYTDVDPVLGRLRKALRREDDAALEEAMARLEELLRTRDLSEPPVTASELARALLPRIDATALGEAAEGLQALAGGRLRRREIDRLATALAALLNAPPPQADTADALRQALLTLVARLEGCEAVAAEAEALAERIRAAGDAEELCALLGDAADLVGQAIDALRGTHGAMTEFLAGVDERLEGLMASIEEVRALDAERRRDGDAFDGAFRRETLGLREDAAGADSLDALRRSIDRRIAAFDEMLREHRRRELERDRRREAHIGELTERLRKTESELGVLRRRLGDTERALGTDPLTGIPNRRAYDRQVEDEFRRWRRYRAPLAIAVVDIDGFKGINDRFGHRAGDKVLRTLARFLSRRLRDTDFVARYGGEEFVILMPGTDAGGAAELAEALRKAVAGLGFHYRDQPVPVTVSLGVTEFREGDDPRRAFERADHALYEAKKAGRNRVVVR